VDHLASLIQASFALNHIPQTWVQAKVIFIPKPGKTDYSDPRCFRPITLSSYILKIVERLTLWFIESEHLHNNPLSPHQCGFRKGHSTDLAITRVVQPLELAKASRSFIAALFMDIKGAFDNVPYEPLLDELRKKHVDREVVDWYKTLLLTRRTTATNEKSGASVTIGHTRGVPQGGILSPLMWNLFFDPLLHALKTEDSEVVAYADDLCLLHADMSPFAAILRSQAALDTMQHWSLVNDIQFCPAKSENILFNWTRVPSSNIPQLTSIPNLSPGLPHANTWDFRSKTPLTGGHMSRHR